MKKLKIISTVVLTLVLSVTVAFGLTMTVDELLQFQGRGGDSNLGAGNYPWHYGDLDVSGALTGRAKTTTVAGTATATTSTLTIADNGTTFIISGTGTTFTLPAVTASDGVNFKFVAGGALDTLNAIIDSAEGDNIEGTLIVAGAVVDCDAEDQINFVVDGENIGDYVEIFSDGSQWLIGDSGVLTTAKMTCTDPS